MNKFTGTGELLAQLDALKNVVGDFAAREEKLNGLFREQSARIDSLFEATGNQQITIAAERMGGEADALAEAKEQLSDRCARRKERISRLHNLLRGKIAAEISAQEDECKLAGQQGLIAAERQRDENLAHAATAFQNFQQRQADINAAFHALEESVRRAFGGCGKFRRQLKAAPTAENLPAGDGTPRWMKSSA